MFIKKYIKKVLKIFILLLLIVSLLLLTSCNSGVGVTGGGINGILHTGTSETCGSGSTADAKGKVTNIDGVEMKLPIDWGHAYRKMGENFKGNNWDGDDGERGIGIFNCGEEGDKSEAYKNSYAINMRWEYFSYGHQAGGYPQHKNYSGTSKSGVDVGGVDDTCVSGDKIIDGNLTSNEAYSAILKAKIIVFNPETNKACVCGTGLTTVGKNNANWGGAPLALLGGITAATADAVEAQQNKSILELYWTDQNAELGPLSNFNGSSGSSGGSNKCDSDNTSNLDYLKKAKEYADDNSIGYSQAKRCHNPDMDCSSFVWYSLKDSGYKLEGEYPFCTMNMGPKLVAIGFEELDFSGPESLKEGDILVVNSSSAAHTEIYFSKEKNQLIGAHTDKDGADGDSSGEEVCEGKYYDDGWQKVYRLKK